MYFPSTPPRLVPNLPVNDPQKEVPPIQKGQNPKKYVMQNFQELKFVDNLYCQQRGALRLFRFHPFSKYMASKLVCSVPSSSLPAGHAEQLLKQYQERCRIKQPHIIYSIASESQNIVRTTSLGQMELFQIYLFFEFNQLTLDQLSDRRKEKKALVPEAEAWCLIKGVVSALLYLQQKEISHGMVSLHNVYFDEEYLLYRVYDQELINGRWGNWIKCQQYKRGKHNKLFTKQDFDDIFQYLAPECQKFIDQDLQLMEEKVNPYKADVYSFGVTATFALSLKQFSSTEKSLEFLRKHYSKELISILESCLQTVSAIRPDWVWLQNKIGSVPESVQNQNLPAKVNTTPLINPPQQASTRKSVVGLDRSINQQSVRKMFDSPISQQPPAPPPQPQKEEEEDVEIKLQLLNQRIQDTLAKSFSKTKIMR